MNRGRAHDRDWTSWALPAIACAGLAFFLLPMIGLLTRVPWGRAGEQLRSEGVVQALGLSLFVSVCAVLLALVFGFPLAWVLARHRFPGRSVVRALVLLPMVLPPIVGGVALLSAFGRNGLLGPVLEAMGVRLAFTTPGAVLAVTFVSAPFMVASIEAGLNGLDRRLEGAGESLGASRWMVIRRVVLPSLRPALLSGIALTWARALGEFGATIAFAGSMPGRTRTLPLAIYSTLHEDLHGAVLLSVILLVASLVILLGLRGRIARP